MPGLQSSTGQGRMSYCGGNTSGQSEDCQSNYRGLYRFSEVRTDHVAQTSLGLVNYELVGRKHESSVTSPLDVSMWRLRYENSFLIGMGPCLSLKRSWVLVMDPLHVWQVNLPYWIP